MLSENVSYQYRNSPRYFVSSPSKPRNGSHFSAEISKRMLYYILLSLFQADNKVYDILSILLVHFCWSLFVGTTHMKVACSYLQG
jgi:hypothetical protein